MMKKLMTALCMALMLLAAGAMADAPQTVRVGNTVVLRAQDAEPG